MGVVTCGGCGLKFNRSAEQAEFIKAKWYHVGCAIIKHDKINLDNYICKIFGLKATGPMNNKLVKKYRDEFGYSYDGMFKALKYFYEIKKNPVTKSEERVGIIPFIYQDTQDYFSYLEKRTERIGEHAIGNKPVEIKINIESVPTIDQKASTSELDSLFDEE